MVHHIWAQSMLHRRHGSSALTGGADPTRPTKSLLGLARCFQSFLRRFCLHAHFRTSGDRLLPIDVGESPALRMVREFALEVLVAVEVEAAMSEMV